MGTSYLSVHTTAYLHTMQIVQNQLTLQIGHTSAHIPHNVEQPQGLRVTTPSPLHTRHSSWADLRPSMAIQQLIFN